MSSAGFAEETDLVQRRMRIPGENVVDGEENVSLLCYHCWHTYIFSCYDGIVPM